MIVSRSDRIMNVGWASGEITVWRAQDKKENRKIEILDLELRGNESEPLA